MTPNHHPSDAVLTDYASGALRTPFTPVVTAHLEHCAVCRAEVARLEAVGFAMIEDLPDASFDPARAARALSSLESGGEAAAAAAQLEFGPEQRDGSVSYRLAPDWAGGEHLYLMRLPAGLRLPQHSHHTRQFTTVLSGAYEDSGEVYAAGDFCELGGSVAHGPAVMRGEDCLCLIANEEPLSATLDAAAHPVEPSRR